MASNIKLSVVPAANPSGATVDRSYQKLAAQIMALIVKGEFAVGKRLPSERALADRFEVSRTSVREAIIALELQGAVDVRGGSGIYVSQAPADELPLFMPQGDPGPFEVLRARCLIESEIAALAAVSCKDSDLDRIFSALSAMRQGMNDKLTNDLADRQFHLCIAESTGNSILLQMVTALWDLRKGPLWVQMDAHFHSPALRDASQKGHQLIFDALLARDPDAARTAMRNHIENVINQFAKAWR